MRNNISILIVEDEFITIDVLRLYLTEYQYIISGDAMNAEEALVILEKGETDLALVDINLGKGNDGIWLANEIRNNFKIPFIFITAYQDAQTIRRASETNPSSYLIKPFRKVDLFSAIEVALANHALNSADHMLPDTALDFGILNEKESVFIKVSSHTFKKIYFREIKYIQAFKNYLELNLLDGKEVIRYTLKGFLEIVPEKDFTKVHRSFIVNHKFIKEINDLGLLVDNQIIPLSTAYIDLIKKKLFQSE